MIGTKAIPPRNSLRNYNHAVAGHAGTMCSDDGDLFIKPCTEAEATFYVTANTQFPDFGDLMPTFMGTLTLGDKGAVTTEEKMGVISESGEIETKKERIMASVARQVAQAEKDHVWVPNKGKKIKTDRALVLENAGHGFKRPNILDCKLGKRLWADDAPREKKERFDKITAVTTHKNLGFRIAGMKVFRGSEDFSELDDEEYKIYNKDYGRLEVNDDNVVDEFRKFIFNAKAGVDQDLGKAICDAFIADLERVESVLASHESRMYSSSLLFVFEGDGAALRNAIRENNAIADRIAIEEETAQTETHTVVESEKPVRHKRAASTSVSDRTNKRIDSGIVLEDADLTDEGFSKREFDAVTHIVEGFAAKDVVDGEIDDNSSEEDELPKVYSLKLIDFAHAQFTPGQGPDENILKGVRSLIRIFKEMAK